MESVDYVLRGTLSALIGAAGEREMGYIRNKNCDSVKKAHIYCALEYAKCGFHKQKADIIGS